MIKPLPEKDDNSLLTLPYGTNFNEMKGQCVLKRSGCTDLH